MANYEAKKKACEDRLKALAADQVRIAAKIEDAKKVLAECERMMAEQKK